MNRGEKMTEFETQVIQGMKRLEQAYLEYRDLNTVLALLDLHIYWVGTGAQEVCSGKEEVRAFLCRQKEETPSFFQVLTSQYQAEQCQNGDCMLVGNLVVKAKEEEAAAFPLRVMAWFVSKENRALVKWIHFSIPSTDRYGEQIFQNTPDKSPAAKLPRLLAERSAELAQRNSEYERLLHNLPGGVLCCDVTPARNLRQYSDGLSELLGYTRQEIELRFGGSFSKLIYEDDRERAAALAKQGGGARQLEYRVRCKNGELRWVLDRGQLVLEEDGQQLYYSVLIDITAKKENEAQLRLSLERHRIIMDQTNDIIFEWDIKADILQVSSNWERTFGYSPIPRHVSWQILGRSVHPEDRGRLREVIKRLEKGSAYEEAELRLQSSEGDCRWYLVRATLQKDDLFQTAKVIGVAADIEKQKKEKEELTRLAQRDALTGIYNKTAMQAAVSKALKTLPAGQGSAFLLLDLDHFKLVNDRYGHLSGDTVLVDFTRRLCALFRETDLVGRVGGDEFAVWISGVSEAGLVEERARMVVETAARVLRDQEITEPIACCVGISLAPADGNDFFSLYRKADLALYHAKAEGRSRYAFYQSGLLLEQGTAPSPGQSEEAPPKEADMARMGVLPSERVLHSLLEILTAGDPLKSAVETALAVMGQKADVSRAWVLEQKKGERFFCEAYEWCAKGIKTSRPSSERLTRESLGEMYACFETESVFYCKEIGLLSKDLHQLLELQDVCSILVCPIRAGGRVVGMIGFDECREKRLWAKAEVELLSDTAKLLSIFLVGECQGQ